METKYFLGKTLNDQVFAVYRATFDKGNLIEELMWQVPNGTEWKSTKKISEWYFLGNDLIFPSTKEEIKKYLPEQIDNLNKYSDDQPRDENGRWTDTGASSGGGSSDNSSGGAGVGNAKDITSELAKEYGTNDAATQRGTELRDNDFNSEARGDVILKDIASKQGFNGEAQMVSQEEFDKIVSEGGTVAYRGITDYYIDDKRISGDEITNEFAKGSYHAGIGVYGNGIYTTTDKEIGNHYATEDGQRGNLITMAIRPDAKIATPLQWHAARMAAKDGKGGFANANNEGRILAAQGFDGFRVIAKNADHPSNQFIIMLNRKALAVLKK